MKFGNEYYDKGERVTFSKINGKWFKSVSCKRCDERILMGGQCQGIAGHKGPHWCYSGDGSYCYDDNDEDPQPNLAKYPCGSTPPDHKDYVSPVLMAASSENYMNARTPEEEVTDSTEIARLEAEKILGEESIVRPFDPSDFVDQYGESIEELKEYIGTLRISKKDEPTLRIRSPKSSFTKATYMACVVVAFIGFGLLSYLYILSLQAK